MHHVAIMNKSWRLIPKILSGTKTIESRWYQTRRAPWNQIRHGDVIWFKDSGEPVTTRATVSAVLQFEFTGSPAKRAGEARKVAREFGKDICLVNTNPKTWSSIPKYCIFIRLKEPKEVKPFGIDKKGFGSGVAWMTIRDVSQVAI